jgi:hypothetical protein
MLIPFLGSLSQQKEFLHNWNHLHHGRYSIRRLLTRRHLTTWFDRACTLYGEDFV